MTDRACILAMIERMKQRFPAKFNESDFEIEENDISVSRGYSGFVAVLSFDENGSLSDISAWE